MKCGSKFGPVPENRDAVVQASSRSSLLQLPGAKFFCEKPGTGTQSKIERKQSLHQAAALGPLPEERGGPPQSHKKVSKFREQLSKMR